jgi:hypothetical protein
MSYGNDTPSSSMERKRKRDDSDEPVDTKKRDLHSTPTSTPRKSVSLNEYKMRKSAAAPASPVTPTFPKTQPGYLDSPRQSEKLDSPSKPNSADQAQAFAEKSQMYIFSRINLNSVILRKERA